MCICVRFLFLQSVNNSPACLAFCNPWKRKRQRGFMEVINKWFFFWFFFYNQPRFARMFQKRRLKGSAAPVKTLIRGLKQSSALFLISYFIFFFIFISCRVRCRWNYQKLSFFHSRGNGNANNTCWSSSGFLCVVIISLPTNPPLTPSLLFFFFRHDSFCCLGTNIATQGICFWQRPAEKLPEKQLMCQMFLLVRRFRLEPFLQEELVKFQGHCNMEEKTNQKKNKNMSIQQGTLK